MDKEKMSQRKDSFDLMTRLTEAELEEESKKLTALIIEKSNLESAKSAASKHYSEMLKEVDAKIETQVPIVADRQMEKRVECLVEYNVPQCGYKRITRLDTNAVVYEIEMTDSEKSDMFYNADEQPEEEAPADAVPEEEPKKKKTGKKNIKVEYSTTNDRIGYKVLIDQVKSENRIEFIRKEESVGHLMLWLGFLYFCDDVPNGGKLVEEIRNKLIKETGYPFDNGKAKEELTAMIQCVFVPHCDNWSKEELESYYDQLYDICGILHEFDMDDTSIKMSVKNEQEKVSELLKDAEQ